MKTYNFEEAAKLLNTSQTSFNKLLTTGTIPAAKFGQSWCITEHDISEYIRQEVERQTLERIEAVSKGEKPKVATARGSLRNVKPDLNSYLNG